MYRSIIEVLDESIARGGTSVSNYVSNEGRRGRFQFQLNVYRRTGQPCPACATLIRRIIVASRSTHFCPRCQKR